jgi:glucose-1-phosphate thymidylyltransferase
MALAKAVVLAAERRDLAQWTAFGLPARQLLPVANRPVLFHHLDALERAGVREAMIVTDEATGPSIRSAIGDGGEWGLAVTHLDHADGESLLADDAVAAFAGAAPVLVHDGDVLTREPLADLADDFTSHELDALILRPGPDAPGTGYILGPSVRDRLRGDGLGLDAGLALLVGAGARIGVRQVDACLPCRGGMTELLEANRRMLERLRPDARAERVFETKIQGAVRSPRASTARPT